MEAIEVMMSRTTSAQLTDPAPDDQTLRAILLAAARAPDHGRLRPWRFAIVRGAARSRLGDLLARSLRLRDATITDIQLERERAKPLRAPIVLVVGARLVTNGKIPVIEQVLATGAAIQNILLAAHAFGYGSAWKTGDAAYATDVKAAFGLSESDAIVGFVYLGTSGHSSQPTNVDVGDRIYEWEASQ